jgi:hypothetical protein
METSGQGNLLGKGKLSGKNFWTRVKLHGKGKLFGKELLAWGRLLNLGTRQTFLASGKLSGKWELLDKKTFLARVHFLERTSGNGETSELGDMENLLGKR